MNTSLTELNDAYTQAVEKGLQKEADNIIEGANAMMNDLLDYFNEQASEQ